MEYICLKYTKNRTNSNLGCQTTSVMSIALGMAATYMIQVYSLKTENLKITIVEDFIL